MLIIDDDVGLCQVMKMFFEDRDYNVTVLHNGHEAISYLETQKPQIVLLDVGLPDLSGLDVLKIIRQTDPNINVVMITGYETDYLMELGGDLGEVTFINKPFGIETLKEIVENIQNEEIKNKEIKDD